MKAEMKTNNYDLHLQYEVGWDDYPVIRAYQMYKDEDNEFCTLTDDVADRYDFTEKDVAWLIENQKQQDGSPYTELSDFYFDEWWHTSDKHLYGNQLPDSAKKWISELPEYELERV